MNTEIKLPEKGEIVKNVKTGEKAKVFDYGWSSSKKSLLNYPCDGVWVEDGVYLYFWRHDEIKSTVK